LAAAYSSFYLGDKMCKCGDYIFGMCFSILSDYEIYNEYNTPDIKDWRCTTEVHFPESSVFEFVSFINSVAKRGWNGTIALDPHRLLWGVKFDTDQPFIVWMSLKELDVLSKQLNQPWANEVKDLLNFTIGTPWSDELTPEINEWNAKKHKDNEY
jgi:hypothetical protein